MSRYAVLVTTLLICGGCAGANASGGGASTPSASASPSPSERVAVAATARRPARCVAQTPGSSAPWQPAQGLAPDLVAATTLLIDLGLPDPRGLEFRSAGFEADPIVGEPRTIHGPVWIWPQTASHEAWAVTLRGDVLLATEVAEAIPIERTSMPERSGGIDAPEYVSRIGARMQREDGGFSPGPLGAILLARLGRVADANSEWAALHSQQGVRPIDIAVLSFVELYFDAGLVAHLHGHDGLAQFHWSRLACARPAIAERIANIRSTLPRVPGEGNDSPLAFLADLDSLLRDSGRRLSAAQPTAAPTDRSALAAADPAALVAALDQLHVDSAEGAYPNVTDHPVAQAILARGPAIVPTLIQALERDDRLTRSAGFVHQSMHRSVAPVRFVLAQLISSLTGMYGVEFGWRSIAEQASLHPREVARALADRWSAVASLSPAERALRALEDDSIGAERQILSLAQLFAAPAGRDNPSHLFLRGTRFAIRNVTDATDMQPVSIDPGVRARLVAAVRRRIVPLQPLSAADESAQRGESLRCPWGQMLYALDPAGSVTFLRETIERQFARDTQYAVTDCVSWLARALLAQGDTSGSTTFARRLREMNYREGELRIIAHEWLPSAASAGSAAVFEAIASHIRDVSTMSVGVPGQAQSTVYVPAVLSIIDAETIRVPEIRDAVVASLNDIRTMEYVQIIPDIGQAMIFNASGIHPIERTGPATGPDFIMTGAMSPLRISDAVADLIANIEHIPNAPPFDPRWVTRRRDRALDDIRHWAAAVAVIERAAPSGSARGTARRGRR